MKPYDVRTNKIVERVYHIAELQNILNDITTDYINQVATMTDEELSDDRSEWIKSVGYGSGAYTKMEYEKGLNISVKEANKFGITTILDAGTEVYPSKKTVPVGRVQRSNGK